MKRFSINLAMVFFIISGVGVFYSAWALHRISPEVLMDDTQVFPQDFPCPDHLILQLHDWFDKRVVVSPGHIKIHGEIERVRVTLSTIRMVAFASVLIWAAFLLTRWRVFQYLNQSTSHAKPRFIT